jgi:hypothetical protein
MLKTEQSSGINSKGVNPFDLREVKTLKCDNDHDHDQTVCSSLMRNAMQSLATGNEHNHFPPPEFSQKRN